MSVSRFWLRALTASIATYSPAALAVDGEPDRSTPFALAVAVGAPEAPELRCSGVLIEPRVVLTVRHCVEALPQTTNVDCASAEFGEPLSSPAELSVSSMRNLSRQGSWHRVQAVRVPTTRKVCGADLAMLVLEGEMPEHEATPAELALDEASFQSAIAERRLGAVGYGVTAPGAEDAGVRRSRWDVPILCVRGDSQFDCDAQVGYTRPAEFVSGPAACTGDSGSGAIDLGQRDRVFGVLSRGTRLGDSCREGIYERTDAWRWWIAKTVQEVDWSVGAEPPAWTFEVLPAPGAAIEDGDLCRSDGDCSAGSSCLSSDSGRSFVCAAACVAESDCRQGMYCAAEALGGHCLMGAPAEAQATCSFSGNSPSSRASALALALVAAGGALRNRMARRLRRRQPPR